VEKFKRVREQWKSGKFQSKDPVEKGRVTWREEQEVVDTWMLSSGVGAHRMRSVGK